jgi:hypothetical protein
VDEDGAVLVVVDVPRAVIAAGVHRVEEYDQPRLMDRARKTCIFKCLGRQRKPTVEAECTEAKQRCYVLVYWYRAPDIATVHAKGSTHCGHHAAVKADVRGTSPNGPSAFVARFRDSRDS